MILSDSSPSTGRRKTYAVVHGLSVADLVESENLNQHAARLRSGGVGVQIAAD